MTIPTDSFDSQDLEHAQLELREGLQTSREMVRQSHVLIELSESSPDFVAANDNLDT